MADVAAIIKCSEVGIYSANLLHVAFPVVGTAVGVDARSTRESAECEHLGGGNFFVNQTDNLLDPGADFFGRIGATIIRADQEDNDLGADPIEFAIRDTPNDMLGLIAADPEASGLVSAVVVLPDMRDFFPLEGDRIAEEEQTNWPGFGSREVLFVELEKVFVSGFGDGLGGFHGYKIHK